MTRSTNTNTLTVEILTRRISGASETGPVTKEQLNISSRKSQKKDSSSKGKNEKEIGQLPATISVYSLRFDTTP
jgi:hypothetical protein